MKIRPSPLLCSCGNNEMSLNVARRMDQSNVIIILKVIFKNQIVSFYQPYTPWCMQVIKRWTYAKLERNINKLYK